MDRNIPHVLDIFVSSPGERRRRLLRTKESTGLDEDQSLQFSRQLKEQKKNPGNDSAVCLCSSSDEDERNISRYFEYLDDLTENQEPNKKVSNDLLNNNNVILGKKDQRNNRADVYDDNKNIYHKKKHSDPKKKADPEDDIKYIERHLSMKKTIRKKMMRDLQQAFVEDPKEFQQDVNSLAPEGKNNINIKNLTITKRKMSKSEHSFLEMLKENEQKDRKGSPKPSALDKSKKSPAKNDGKSKMDDHDSGNESPPASDSPKRITSPVKNKPSSSANKDDKKSLWQRITGKSKSKR